MKLLDLFCGAGGAARGYQQAGFHVTGIDIVDQPRYAGDIFIQADALQYVAAHGKEFDVIHASPPCQHYSLTQRIQANKHPDLIAPTRLLLRQSGLPWVIENVEGSPLIDPITLCGAMFDLRTYRHRLFEASFPLLEPKHPAHVAPVSKMGRPRKPGEFAHYVGNFSGVEEARQDMEMPWANRDGLREAIPPAYTRLIGRQLALVAA